MKNIHTRTRRVHLVAGLILAGLFIASGIYLRFLFSKETGAIDIAHHMLYRANHVYLLTAALVNLLFIANLKPPVIRWQYLLQRLASAAVLVASILVVWAFVTEPQQMTLHRPITISSMLTLASGVLVLLLVNLKSNN